MISRLTGTINIIMRRSNRNFNIPAPGKPRAFELLKIGSFKFPPPGPKWCSKSLPHRRICLSNAPPKEQSSSVPVVCHKACAYSRYAETLIQDGNTVHGTRYACTVCVYTNVRQSHRLTHSIKSLHRYNLHATRYTVRFKN